MSNIMAEVVAESQDRRREFRQYLVDGGVLDAVVKAVVSLYACEEKPMNPVDFVRKVMGDLRPTAEDMETLISDVKGSKAVQRSLAQDNRRLRERLQELEPDSDLLVSSVVTPELLQPLEEERAEESRSEAASDYGEGEMQMEQGEQFQLSKSREQSDAVDASEDPEDADEPVHHGEALSVASEGLQPEVKSIQSEAVSEKKSAAAVEEHEEPPAVAASDGGQALLPEEDDAPLH